ncbi:hypothetical protein J5N97_005379 [Dioscorea zingiberensis]|uniref:Small nuclear ribonucleoprotein E n=1 Tax=Dioscorea zingiberensis TaxID=325984 RepID=A0A9D5DA30_9LILI|nr:hypothetical protein J5N97_005379 [Dioscorea zingiberensis]
MATTKVQRIMTQPINLIFRFLQSKARIQIWLFEQKDSRIEGRIIGFDEYMNLVLDDAEEINVKKKTRKQLGRILIKGDKITLMMISVVATKSSVIFIGTGEHMDEFEVFDVKPFVSRLLGMGDWSGFMDKIHEVVPTDQQPELDAITPRLVYEEFQNIPILRIFCNSSDISRGVKVPSDSFCRGSG